jgi:hypothetical protein
MRATPVTADLVTDTRLTGLTAGKRSGADDEQPHRYQLLFRQGDDTDVLLDVESDSADRIHIRGQVLVSPGVRPVFEATATWPGGSQRALDGDDLGGFVLRNLPTTTRELLVTNDDLAIQLRLPEPS